VAAEQGNQLIYDCGKVTDVLVIRYVAASAEAGRTGIIGAYSNSGGTDSLGTDDHTYKSVGAFFDFIAQNGGDRTRAIMSGGSRGGIDSLMWAINPLKLNYNGRRRVCRHSAGGYFLHYSAQRPDLSAAWLVLCLSFA